MNVGDTVMILNGRYKDKTAMVTGTHYIAGGDVWMVDVTVEDSVSISLSDDRVRKLVRRVEGEKISLSDLQVGDEIEVAYMVDDVRMSRVGVVGYIDNLEVLSRGKTLLHRTTWGYSEEEITLLEAHKVHPLEEVGVGTSFLMTPDGLDGAYYRLVKYDDSFWIDELRRADDSIASLNVISDQDARTMYVEAGTKLEVK